MISGDIMTNFSKLKDIREDYDISQEKMAKILGVKRSAYSLWELGINIIPLKNLFDYAIYFNVSMDYILGLSDTKKGDSNKKGLDLMMLGHNMKSIRLYNHLSQENVADLLGVTQACIARYEKGLICISTANLYKFALTLDVSFHELCTRTF